MSGREQDYLWNDTKYLKFDPVLAQIYNMDVSESGRPFTICRKHYKQMEKRLNRRAPMCILSIIALFPIDQDCEHCENGEDINE